MTTYITRDKLDGLIVEHIGDGEYRIIRRRLSDWIVLPEWVKPGLDVSAGQLAEWEQAGVEILVSNA